MTKFLRRIHNRYSKLGKRRKKKQVWRRPTGRDNKMREKRRGYPAVVSIGYKKDKKSKGIIKGKKPKIIRNARELGKIGKNEIGIVGNVGKKKRIEIAKKAKEMKIKLYNLNVGKFLKEIEKPKEEKKVGEKDKRKTTIKETKKPEEKKK